MIVRCICTHLVLIGLGHLLYYSRNRRHVRRALRLEASFPVSFRQDPLLCSIAFTHVLQLCHLLAAKLVTKQSG